MSFGGTKSSRQPEALTREVWRIGAHVATLVAALVAEQIFPPPKMSYGALVHLHILVGGTQLNRTKVLDSYCYGRTFASATTASRQKG